MHSQPSANPRPLPPSVSDHAHFTPTTTSTLTLCRQVIKSDFATVTFKEIEFEIPPRQRGEVTTVEGLLRTSAEKLGEAQDLRMERSPEVWPKVVKRGGREGGGGRFRREEEQGFHRRIALVPHRLAGQGNGFN